MCPMIFTFHYENLKLQNVTTSRVPSNYLTQKYIWEFLMPSCQNHFVLIFRPSKGRDRRLMFELVLLYKKEQLSLLRRSFFLHSAILYFLSRLYLSTWQSLNQSLLPSVMVEYKQPTLLDIRVLYILQHVSNKER